MMDYMKVGKYGLEIDQLILFGLEDALLHAAHVAMDCGCDLHNPIVDVDYEELEPDPNDGHAPMASLVYNPKK